SGCFTGDGTSLKYCTGRRQTKRSSICRNATLSDRIPPPTGVVSGPLIPTRYSRNASTVSSGSQLSNLSFAAWPANTSNHATFFLPPYAFSIAASKTRSEEHTSELQSLRHLVCRLLLEKKKKKH